MSTTNISNNPGTAPGADESSGVKDQAQEAAGTAADEGRRVAGVAKGEVKNVTAEAQNQLKGLLAQATTQVDEQSKQQKNRLAETVRTFGDDLHEMTSNENAGGGMATQVVQQVADQARGLASRLDDREPREILEDARRFARQRPGTFLVGALAAGIVVGRLARSAKAAQDETSTQAPTKTSTAASAGDVRRSLPVDTTATSPATSAPRSEEDSMGNGHRVSGQPDDRVQTDLGHKGVEMSEAGVRPSGGGPA